MGEGQVVKGHAEDFGTLRFDREHPIEKEATTREVAVFFQSVIRYSFTGPRPAVNPEMTLALESIVTLKLCA